LAVLAAVYSIIGRKQVPVLITQDRIRQRALGYKTAAAMADELPRRSDGGHPLSSWQLRSVLACLRTRKLFVSATYGRRLTYYSHRMTSRALRAAVIERKTRRFISDRLHRLDDDSMSSAIRNQRAALLGDSPADPDAHPLIFQPTPTPEDFVE